MTSSQQPPVTLPKQGPPSPLLNLATYPPTVRFLLMWTLAQPHVSMLSEWKQKSAVWREEQVQRIREEQQRYCQRWVAAAHAARTSWTWAPAPAEDTTARERQRQPVRFKTPSVHATLTVHDAPSVCALSRTANAKPVHLQARNTSRARRSPEGSSRSASATTRALGCPLSPTTTTFYPTHRQRLKSQWRRGGGSPPRRHELEEDKGGGRTEGGEAHRQLSKRAKKCKGK